MGHQRTRISRTATAVICSVLALQFGASAVQAADPPATAIKSDAHQLAVDVQREAHVVGRRVERQTHDFNRKLLQARAELSVQLHQFGNRVQRWWHRPSTS